ncbi:uncharacterized protein MONBRDRAFT_19129 [Monosiga brevicollis MX1]|uniref:AAA+ ATPase domain-containing protein n=1 Tax=Monosiga brevicollis TaxID=81824 RepID=A9UPI5_MONBE|nr:uncharacterized protein MONBRDRAFT_19129 [Monosiga brevicollis MX1]EDQ92429.1 predicted protein [Monosiga brevicollis MX1]|eukprot:XP_001742191.1 hypothetical protein [Monosiga brevicollis MX1]
MLFGSFIGDAETKLQQLFEQARAQAGAQPAVIFLDEIDAICPKRVDGRTGESRLVAQLLTLLDGIDSQRRQQLIIIGATNRPNALDAAVRRPGRLDREIVIPPLNHEARLTILQRLLRATPTDADLQLAALAERLQGFVGADVAALVREASLHAARRGRQTVGHADFIAALGVVVPAGHRRDYVDVRPTAWEDIGGLEAVKEEIRQAIEWPLHYREAYERLQLQPPRGILLYGPPGCSKTTMARAVASSAHATFFAVNGAQIFSPYVGDSEAELRRIFQRARASAPSVIFFDEVDALVGRRDGEGSSVAARVLSTLLNEMDGIESAGNVMVLAATNRPDQLDAAFVRPGRIDRAIYIPPPDGPGRRAIITAVCRTMPVDWAATDLADLEARTADWTGADVKSLCQEAALACLRRGGAKMEQQDFASALTVVSPSLSRDDLQFYANLRVAAQHTMLASSA